MSEDRSKLPSGLLVQHKGWHTERRPACYVVVDTRETTEAEVREDAWAFVDSIRAEERAMLVDLLRTLGHDDSAEVIEGVNDEVRRVWTRREEDVRADERERIAVLLEDGGAIGTLGLYDGNDIAAWLRAGAKGEP